MKSVSPQASTGPSRALETRHKTQGAAMTVDCWSTIAKVFCVVGFERGPMSGLVDGFMMVAGTSPEILITTAQRFASQVVVRGFFPDTVDEVSATIARLFHVSTRQFGMNLDRVTIGSETGTLPTCSMCNTV